MTDWNKILKQHRAQFGTTYLLPNGQFIRLKDDELKDYLINNGLRVRQPSFQGSSEIEAQVGIK